MKMSPLPLAPGRPPPPSSFATQHLLGPRPLHQCVLRSRCVRCGAGSREFLCPACSDYLIAYHPLWLDPGLLPGPSLLHLAAPRERPFVSSDLVTVEWAMPNGSPTASDAVQLIRLLGLDESAHPVMSVGDADVLHSFLRDARRSPPVDTAERDALAAVYRYLASCEWVPPHLASEYRLRASVLGPAVIDAPRDDAGPGEPVQETAEPATVASAEAPEAPMTPPAEESVEPARPPPPPGEVEEELSEPLPEVPETDFDAGGEEVPLPAPDPFPPLPNPEPPLPLPEPLPRPEPGPPEQEPEPEAFDDHEKWMELESRKQLLERERIALEEDARRRTSAIREKESSLEQRERAIATREREVEEQAQGVTERLLAVEKVEARRDVLRFLGTVPGMGESQAEAIATAFSDMASLQAADERSLAQCEGVTDALARSIRYELMPGAGEEERRAVHLREEAQAFLAERAYEAALDCYDRLLRERPEETGLWYDRANVLGLLRRVEDALESYQKVLDRDRDHRQAWFERANLLFGLGRTPEAIESLRQVLRIAPSKTADIALRAEQLRRDGDPNGSVLVYRAILDVNPGDTRSVLGLEDALLDLGDAEAAETLLTRALGTSPQNAAFLFRKGELLERKGRWGAAIQHHNRAIAVQWNFLSPWIAKGRILLDHNRAPEALEGFEKVLSFDPKNAEAWAGKAHAHATLGDRQSATAALEQATGRDPENPFVRRALEAVEGMTAAGPEAPPLREEGPQEVAERSREGSPPELPEEPIDESLEELQDELFEEPEELGSPRDFKSLVKAFEEIEEEPEAAPGPSPEASLSGDFQSFVESVEPDDDDVHVLLELAELALEGGDPYAALARYEEALEKGGRNADAWTGKGIALQRLERYQEALEAYDHALSLKPDHALAQEGRAACLRHLEPEGPK